MNEEKESDSNPIESSSSNQKDEDLDDLKEIISDQDLLIAESVLKKIGENFDSLKAKRFRTLRKHGIVFTNIFQLANKSSEDKQKEKKKRKRAEAYKRQQLDAKFRNNASLRQQRIDALNALTVPDNLLLTNGSGQKAIEASSTSSTAEPTPSDSYAKPQSCYVCKKKYKERHHFYDCLCPECADLNWFKRNRIVDLKDRVILVTGGRVKIGFEAAVKLLRCGATVHVTTRFPNNAAKRYAELKDFKDFSSRLHIHGLDLRDLGAVERFAAWFCEQVPELDALINNAAQTVRRPPAYYSHLLTDETVESMKKLPKNICDLIQNGNWHQSTVGRIESGESRDLSSIMPGNSSQNEIVNQTSEMMSDITPSAAMSQLPLLPEDHENDKNLFPKGVYDVDGQQMDLREKNSWNYLLHEVPTAEAVEVHCVNALAPMVLCARFRTILKNGAKKHGFSWIVNVSAMEAKFYRHKEPTHAHTNMAKAALNMLTRTSASDYKTDNILMNSIDTGWITDEQPTAKAMEKLINDNFQTPIDEIDAACRIIDPIIVGVGGQIKQPEFFPVDRFCFGKFIKDYRESEW